jgi:hypothetical protein
VVRTQPHMPAHAQMHTNSPRREHARPASRASARCPI